MNPYLDPQLNPRIKLEVYASSWHLQDFLIDTGFSGGLALSHKLLSDFKQTPIAFQKYELADGSFSTFAVFQTRVRYKQIKKEVTLIFTKSNESLVGIEFLRGFKFALDLRKYKITLE